jgi:protein YibB
MNDLIIAASKNYNYEQIRPWIETFKQVNSICDMVILVDHNDQNTIKHLTDLGITAIPIYTFHHDFYPIHVTRFKPIYDYLKTNKGKYRYVITTDIRDVIFQTDPFIWMENNLKDKQLLVGSESIQYKNETIWGAENLRQSYGQEIYDLNKDHTIYCCGVIAGLQDAVASLVLDMYNDAITNPIPVSDQAAMNVLLHTPKYIDQTLFANQSDGFVCHAGTVASRTRMDIFRPHLIEDEPVYKDKKVLTSSGNIFSIVHQYDTTSWNLLIKNITIVTVFYDLNRENWTAESGYLDWIARPKSTYFKYFSNLATLENKIIVYTTQDNVELIKSIRGNKPTEIIVFDLLSEFKDLRDKIQTTLDKPEYKAKIDAGLLTHPQYRNADYSLVMFSKPYFINDAVERGLVDTELVAWADFGSCRTPFEFAGIKNWQTDLSSNKINLFGFIYPDKNLDIENMVRYNQVHVTGTIIILGKGMSKLFWEFSKNTLNELIDQLLISEDQCLFSVCVSKMPEIFSFHYLPENTWFDTISNTHKFLLEERTTDVRILYLNILGREPDQCGWDHYVNSQFSINEIRDILLNSDEYRDRQHS